MCFPRFPVLSEMSLNHVVLWWNSQAEANHKSPRKWVGVIRDSRKVTEVECRLSRPLSWICSQWGSHWDSETLSLRRAKTNSNTHLPWRFRILTLYHWVDKNANRQRGSLDSDLVYRSCSWPVCTGCWRLTPPCLSWLSHASIYLCINPSVHPLAKSLLTLDSGIK